MTFSERFKELRIEKQLSQMQIVETLKISRRMIQGYEAGTSEPTLSKLILIADLFEVSLDYLVGRTDNPEINK